MITATKRMLKVFRYLYTGEDMEVDVIQAKLRNAELDLNIVMKSMKAVIETITERVDAISAIGQELEALHNPRAIIPRKDQLITDRVEYVTTLCKEVSDLKQLLDETNWTIKIVESK